MPTNPQTTGPNTTVPPKEIAALRAATAALLTLRAVAATGSPFCRKAPEESRRIADIATTLLAWIEKGLKAAEDTPRPDAGAAAQTDANSNKGMQEVLDAAALLGRIAALRERLEKAQRFAVAAGENPAAGAQQAC